jgi:hypothetical protein
MPLKTTPAFCCSVGLLTLIILALPDTSAAQRGPGLASPALRDACRAQVRALNMRGAAGGNAERHRMAMFRQCMRNRAGSEAIMGRPASG